MCPSFGPKLVISLQKVELRYYAEAHWVGRNLNEARYNFPCAGTDENLSTVHSDYGSKYLITMVKRMKRIKSLGRYQVMLTIACHWYGIILSSIIYINDIVCFLYWHMHNHIISSQTLQFRVLWQFKNWLWNKCIYTHATILNNNIQVYFLGCCHSLS